MSNLTDVIITGDASKLPADYAALVDPSQPLPTGITAFEKRIVSTDLVKTIGFTIGFAMLGVIMVILGISFIRGSIGDRHGPTHHEYWPLLFGLACLLASWMMATSLRKRSQLMKDQQAGKPTRLGIFLTSEAIFEVNEFGYCIIPRARFRGLKNGAIQYEHAGQTKSTRLPQNLVNGVVASMTAEINRWAQPS